MSHIWHPRGFRAVIREITILRKLSKHKSNKFTVKLFDVFQPKEGLSREKPYLFLVMSHHKHNLGQMLENVTSFSENQLVVLVYNLLSSFKYIHSLGLLHRDIKPSNILVNSDCTIKMCDFGWARTLTQEIEPTRADMRDVMQRGRDIQQGG